MNAFDFISSFGPTPLAELTARMSEDAAQVAEQLNALTGQDMLRVVDQDGNPVTHVSPDQAKSELLLVKLSPRSIRKSLAS